MGYRPPSHPPVTDWARYIDRVKRERNWSATKAFEAAREAGLPIGAKSRAAYLPYEVDREPDEATAAIFEVAFGGRPDPELDAPPPAAAQPDLAQAVVSLTEEVALMRAERVAIWHGILRALAAPGGEAVAEALRASLEPLLRESAPAPQPNGSRS